MHALTESDASFLPARTAAAPLAAPLTVAEITAVTALLKAVAGPIRLRLLQALAEERELAIGELTERVGAPYAAVSEHLGRLRAAGLVGVRRSGHRVLYRTTNPHLPTLLTAARRLAARPAPVRPDATVEHTAERRHTEIQHMQIPHT
ncbi:ArsR/SmtB family transcription factor [Streptomyces sp. NPDC057743]|uniref:ArsR/SmtB family transcription factor n=1 Tax=Streptomyces sp. NPDC057743 TaxID=3346236 RepID=UPI00369E98AE